MGRPANCNPCCDESACKLIIVITEHEDSNTNVSVDCCANDIADVLKATICRFDRGDCFCETEVKLYWNGLFWENDVTKNEPQFTCCDGLFLTLQLTCCKDRPPPECQECDDGSWQLRVDFKDAGGSLNSCPTVRSCIDLTPSPVSLELGPSVVSEPSCEIASSQCSPFHLKFDIDLTPTCCDCCFDTVVAPKVGSAKIVAVACSPACMAEEMTLTLLGGCQCDDVTIDMCWNSASQHWAGASAPGPKSCGAANNRTIQAVMRCCGPAANPLPSCSPASPVCEGTSPAFDPSPQSCGRCEGQFELELTFSDGCGVSPKLAKFYGCGVGTDSVTFENFCVRGECCKNCLCLDEVPDVLTGSLTLENIGPGCPSCDGRCEGSFPMIRQVGQCKWVGIFDAVDCPDLNGELCVKVSLTIFDCEQAVGCKCYQVDIEPCTGIGECVPTSLANCCTGVVEPAIDIECTDLDFDSCCGLPAVCAAEGTVTITL